MSKKRFIKLMMGRGYSRNTATALAFQVFRYGSYALMYQHFTDILLPEKMLSRIIPDLYNSLAVMCDAVATVFSGLAENLRRAANG